MKRFEKSALVAVVLGLAISSFAMADSGPDSSADSQADASVASSGALGQFPQAEIQALAQSQAAASIATASGATSNPAGINFPKVKTREDEILAKRFAWWPSDATPAPYKDESRSGFWWWPTTPGESKGPWGNQGFVYVRKVIFDYKSSEGDQKPSLVIKKILKNVKVLFDYDKADLRDDAQSILSNALYTLEKNPNADVLITGNADIRGSEQYNQKLGARRAEAVRQFFAGHGLPESRIRILSRGKLDAMAPTHDLVGMQKDRNAQFMVAEVEEVMIPASQASQFGETNTVEEKHDIESSVKVDVKDYTIQKGDTLWAIAEKEYGDGRQWKRIYEFNKDVISNPNRPKKGTKIQIPIE